MGDNEMSRVPKKAIDIAIGVLRDNGYVPVTGGNRVTNISEWKLPGSDTTLGVKPEGTQVAVIMDYASKKPTLLSGGEVPASFTVRSMDDLMRFATDFAKVAQAKGVPLPKENEFAARKQKIGPS
jgi:hypothetical protein